MVPGAGVERWQKNPNCDQSPTLAEQTAKWMPKMSSLWFRESQK